METGVKLQVGKWYRRRDGEVVGPVKECNFHRTGKYPFVAGGSTYTADGRYYYNNNATIFDLVEEVPAPTAQPEPPAAKPVLQPIATAPKDGTDILVWYDHDADPSVDPDYPDSMTAYALCVEFGEFLAGKGFTIAKWHQGSIELPEESGSVFSMPPYWFSRGDYACYDRACHPVYWMALPEAPGCE